MSELHARLRALVLAAPLFSMPALAQGYQLQQHEPTAAGETFFSVHAPRYDGRHALAVGLTLNYGHHPLLGGRVRPDGTFVPERPVLSDQLLGHLDVSGVLLGRLQLAASLPVTLLEAGTGGYGVTPVSGVVAGDPRLGARLRLFGEDRGALALHVGGDVWIPVGVSALHAGDSGLRGALGVVVDGWATSSVRWALNGGVLWRPEASLNLVSRGHGTVGPALQAGAAIGYVAPEERFHVGPEVVASTGLGDDAFTIATSRVEVLLGGGYRIGDHVEVGPAVGMGLVRSAGTPDFRALLRLTVLPFGGTSDEGSTAERTEETDTDAGNQAPTEAPREEAAADRGLETESANSPEPEPEPESVSTSASEPSDDADVAQVPAPQAAPPAREPAPVQARETPRTQQDAPAIAVVRFASDSAELSPDAESQLRDVLGRITGRAGARIVIEGHGDNRGPEAWNERLSTLRAESVRRFLRAEGVSGARMDVTSRGSSEPVRDNGTAAGRAANRRVEVRFE